jgi:hypothetical protein
MGLPALPAHNEGMGSIQYTVRGVTRDRGFQHVVGLEVVELAPLA